MNEKLNIWLAAENLSVGGYVEYLECSVCNNESFHLKLLSENDSNYMGIVGLTDKINNRLVVTHLREQELYNWSKEQIGKIENRINTVFNTNELEFIESDYFIDLVTNEQVYKPKCPKCSGIMNQIKVINLNEFIGNGGQIIAMDIYEKK